MSGVLSVGQGFKLTKNLTGNDRRAKIASMFLKPLGRSVLTALLAGVLMSCSSSSSSVAFSCTDAGRDKTLEVAHEIVDTIGDARLEGTLGKSAHGCDSTARGLYDFRALDRDAVTTTFSCREDDSVDDDWLLCNANSGPFALAPERGGALFTIEVLP